MKGKNYFHNPMVQVRLWHPQKENVTFPSSVCAASTHNDVTSALNNDNDDDDGDNSGISQTQLLVALSPSSFRSEPEVVDDNNGDGGGSEILPGTESELH